MSTGTIIAGFVLSSVGFGLFLFGKKQRRAPQLIAGMLMMLAPFVVTDPLWMSVLGLGLVVGMQVAIRYEV